MDEFEYVSDMTCEFTNLISDDEFQHLFTCISYQFDSKLYMMQLFREHNRNANREYYKRKLERWKEKKRKQTCTKQITRIRYMCRSEFAKTRERVNGRFIPKPKNWFFYYKE